MAVKKTGPVERGEGRQKGEGHRHSGQADVDCKQGLVGAWCQHDPPECSQA